jgi:hypothetical protein
MVTYAFVRRYSQVTRGAMMIDLPIPGIEGRDEIQGDPSVWHTAQRLTNAEGLRANGCAPVEN